MFSLLANVEPFFSVDFMSRFIKGKDNPKLGKIPVGLAKLQTVSWEIICFAIEEVKAIEIFYTGNQHCACQTQVSDNMIPKLARFQKQNN